MKLYSMTLVPWRELREFKLPVFYRPDARDERENVIAVRVFEMPEGRASVVSWPLPEPGLRVFSPTPEEPDGTREALPYALFLLDHNEALRVTVELDDGMTWSPEWGELVNLPA